MSFNEEYRITMRNELSGPAETAASSLGDLQRELRQTSAGLDVLERKQKTVARSLAKTSATSAVAGPKRDAQGRLRHANGRFLTEKEKAALGLTAAGSLQRGMPVPSRYTPRSGPTARRYAYTGKAFAELQASREALAKGPSAQLGGVERAASGASSSVASSFSSGAAVAAVAAVAVAVGGLILKLGQLTAAAGAWLVQAQMARQAALLSFKLSFGGINEASAVYKQAIALSSKLGQSAEETVSIFQTLGAQGMKAPQIESMAKSLADLKLVAPGVDSGRAIAAIGQIMSKGKLGLEELQGQLGDSANLNVGYVKDALGEILKVRGKTEAEIRGKVDKLISAGSVDSQTGLKAVQMAISRMAGGGEAGAAAISANKSLGGTLTQLANLPKNLAISFDLPGTEPIIAFGQTLLKVFDLAKQGGAASKLQQSIGGLFSAVTGALGSVLPGESGIEKMVGGVVTALDTAASIIRAVAPISKAFLDGLMEGFGEVWQAVSPLAAELAKAFGAQFTSRGELLATVARAVGKGFAYVAVAVGAVVSVVAALGAIIPSVVGALAYGVAALVAVVVGGIGSAVTSVAGFASSAFDAGMSIVDGIASGIMAGLSKVTEAASSIGSEAVSAVRSTLDIHSPSRVMAELGGHTAAGFAMGVNDNAGPVDSAMTSLVTPQLSAGGGASGGRGSQPITINITVNANGAEGEGIAERVERVAREAIRDVLDQLGAEVALTA